MLELKLRYHATHTTAQRLKKKSHTTNAAFLRQLIPVISLLGLTRLRSYQFALFSIGRGNIIIHLALLSRMMFLSKDGKEKQHVALEVLAHVPSHGTVGPQPATSHSATRRGDQPATQTDGQALRPSCSLSAELPCTTHNTCCKSPSISHSLIYYAISPQRCNHIRYL